MSKFVNILAICQTIVVQKKDNQLVYNASSPDELALANAARHFGIVFEGRDDDENIVLMNKHLNKRFTYELLNIIEFTSERKRMSVIVRTPDGKILCMTKGADSIIASKLAAGQESLLSTTSEYLDEYANEGLRTLLVAQKEVDPEFYKEWNEKYKHAMFSMDKRKDEKLN